MDKNTLSHYGLILVSTLIITAILAAVSPLSPFGFSAGIRNAINETADGYFEKTGIEKEQVVQEEIYSPDNPQEIQKTLNIEFVYEDGSKASEPYIGKYNYGTKIDYAPIIPEIDGYTPSSIPHEDIIYKNTNLKIIFVANTFNIKYITNGGTIVGDKIEKYTVGKNVALPTNVYKDGTTFVGWFEEQDLSGTPIFEILPETYGDKVYYAKYDENRYALTYTISGDINIVGYPKTIYISNEQEPFDLPVLEDQGDEHFVGWYDNASLQGLPITRLPSSPSSNLTLYAKFSKEIVVYTACLMDDEDVIQEIKYSEGDTYTFDKSITKTGYTFASWNTRRNGSGENIDGIVATDKSDITLYAQWQPRVYYMSFNLYGGTMNTTNDYSRFTYGQAFHLPSQLEVVRPMYTLVGWRTEGDGKGNLYPCDSDIEIKNAHDTTLYAQWEIGDKFVIYNPNGGNFDGSTDPQRIKCSYKSCYILPEILPSKVGYEFSGWVNEDGQRITPDTVCNEDAEEVVTATWTPKTYSVKLMLDGGTMSDADLSIYKETTQESSETETITFYESSYTCGTEVILPNASSVSKKGYVFDHWEGPEGISKISTTTVGDVVFYAKFKPIQYRIVFDTNGGSVENGSLSFFYGQGMLDKRLDGELTSVSILGEAHLDGFDFVGWKMHYYTIDEESNSVIDHGDIVQTTIPCDFYSNNGSSAGIQYVYLTAVYTVKPVDVQINYVDTNGEIVLYSINKEITVADENGVETTTTIEYNDTPSILKLENVDLGINYIDEASQSALPIEQRSKEYSDIESFKYEINDAMITRNLESSDLKFTDFNKNYYALNSTFTISKAAFINSVKNNNGVICISVPVYKYRHASVTVEVDGVKNDVYGVNYGDYIMKNIQHVSLSDTVDTEDKTLFFIGNIPLTTYGFSFDENGSLIPDTDVTYAFNGLEVNGQNMGLNQSLFNQEGNEYLNRFFCENLSGALPTNNIVIKYITQ